MELFRTIRGVEVKITSDEWDGDESVGISYGPSVIYAETFDGQEFLLTPEEETIIAMEATKNYYSDNCFPDEWT